MTFTTFGRRSAHSERDQIHDAVERSCSPISDHFWISLKMILRFNVKKHVHQQRTYSLTLTHGLRSISNSCLSIHIRKYDYFQITLESFSLDWLFINLIICKIFSCMLYIMFDFLSRKFTFNIYGKAVPYASASRQILKGRQRLRYKDVRKRSLEVFGLNVIMKKEAKNIKAWRSWLKDDAKN